MVRRTRVVGHGNVVTAVREDREGVRDPDLIRLAECAKLQQRAFGDLAQEIACQRFAAVVEPDDRMAGQCAADETLLRFLGVRCDCDGSDPFAGRYHRRHVGEITLTGPGLRRGNEMHRHSRHGAAQHRGQEHRQGDRSTSQIGKGKLRQQLDHAASVSLVVGASGSGCVVTAERSTNPVA